MEDGLPERMVTSLAQTPDGYLWCGTYSGLARFDGEHFKTFDPANVAALDGVRIRELRCDSKGRLWIRGQNGELVVLENGQFRRVTDADGLPLHQAGKLGSNRDGDLWVKGRSDDHFYRFLNGRFAVVNSGIAGSDVDRFIAGNDRLSWAVLERERTMMRFTPRGPELEPSVLIAGEPDRWLGRFFHLQSGQLAVTSSRGIHALRDSQWSLQAAFDPTVPSQALDGVEDWDGNFWVSFVSVGLVCHTRSGRTAAVSLPGQADAPFLQAVILDAEGNVWTCGSEGLYQIRRNAFRSQPGLAGMEEKPPSAVIEDAGGTVWLCCSDHLVRLCNDAWESQPNPHPGANITTATASRDGGIYFGLADFNLKTEFVEKVSSDGERRQLGSVKGFPRVIVERDSGEIWVATDIGVWQSRGEGFERVHITGAEGDYEVYAMLEDRPGRMLVGAFQHGLFRLERDGDWHRLTTTNDLGSNLIVSLYLDEQGTLWAATDRGLARWKTKTWFAYSNADDALPGWVRGVVSDGQRGLWLTSQYGVTQVDRKALNDRADGKDIEVESTWFDRSDGLPSVTCLVNQKAVLRSTDGRIWVATAKGAAVVNPIAWAEHRDRLGAPHVHIKSVLVDDKAVPIPGKELGGGTAAPLVLPPESSRVEFRFSAINLTANRKNRFRYQLEGFSDGWVNAGDQKSAVYHRLPPGDYRFQVMAANHYGLWSDPVAQIPFTVRPYWWQTLWFRIGAAIFIFGVLWGSRSFKLRQLRRERVRREEFSRRLIQSQEAERKRIASELHDSLGQNLLIAKNQLFLVQEMTANQDERVQPKLNQVAESVGAALDEARAISHQLRPFQLERLGLTKAIRSMIKQTSESTKLPIEVHLESVDALLPPESEVMLYRILQEALSNIVKHADASKVKVIIERMTKQIRMVIEDDGRGFDLDDMLSAEHGPGGLGLTGFEERTSLLRGKYECRSALGQGTILTFEIPVRETQFNDATNQDHSG